MSTATILVVEDNDTLREYVVGLLAQAGYDVVEVANVPDGRALIDTVSLDLAFLDLELPPDDGRDLLRYLRSVAGDVPAIILTADNKATSAMELMRLGAFDYLVKPVDAEELLRRAAQGVELYRARRALVNWRDVRSREARPWHVGQTPRMLALETLVNKCAKAPASVLIQGESGTGKEVVAHALHNRSARAEGPFIAINCAALPKELLETELFGHERGAFTGAIGQRRGMLELANGGTLFLDELTSMHVDMQAKLLRALQEFQFRRVGGAREIKVDVRVISASNRDVVEAVRSGAFREDLFYRLCVLTLELPPLRERRADIPHFVAEFLAEFRREMGTTLEGVSDAALLALTQYAWPGNIRELRNAVERAVIVANGAELIEAADLPPSVRDAAQFLPAGDTAKEPGLTVRLPAEGLDLKAHVAAWEKSMVVQALARTGGNRTAAGQILGLTRDEIRYRMDKHGLEP